MSDHSTVEYLVIGAHPDDAEIGVGGTILSLRSQGARVGILDLTDGEPTPFGSCAIRASETAAATQLLGVDWRGNLGLTNRAVVADLESRAKLAGMLRLLRPRVIITHYWEDAHPDHVAASALVDAARFWAKLSKTDMPGTPHFPEKIVYFYSMHLRQHAQPSFVLDITPHLEKKIEVLKCYPSQLIEGRPTTPPTIFDQVRTLAGYWGWTIGSEYGEAFRTREEVGLASLQSLR